MEFLVMQDTAKTAAISIEKLFIIIEEEKNKLKTNNFDIDKYLDS